MADTTVKSGGIGFCGLLTVLFIGLKLTGYVAWSWWWVLSPLWIPWGIVLGVIGTVAIGALLITFASNVIEAPGKIWRMLPGKRLKK